ncbi:MAG TPA: hypothetical protein VFM05_14375 [Candidatus Saccharimonadales bacterium]|nr:hypothetical protein [Candidatus Saccharimonadales bacterium]
MDTIALVIYIVGFLSLAAAGAFVLTLVDYIRLTKGTRNGELVVVWGAAAGGSIVGSFLMSLLGMILAMVIYPNTEEYAAAFVGGMFGSCVSIPAGIFVGVCVGTVIADILLRLHGGRPGFIASTGAFVTAVLAAGVSLVPVGFLFYGLGHI